MALQVDALGNYFRMYGHAVWSNAIRRVLTHGRAGACQSTDRLACSPVADRRYRLPFALTAIFAGTIVFSLSAAYEIIELWDEIYFGGKRIWGPYDTATDLQWDLCGIIVGTLFSCIMLRDTRDQLVPH